MKANDDTLIVAIDAGDLERVRALLASGSSPRVTSAPWHSSFPAWPALNRAVVAGQRDIVGVLIAAGADVDVVCRYDYGGDRGIEHGTKTALLSALQIGREDIALDLIAAGANVDVGDDGTPLQWAATKGFVVAIEELLRRGARDPEALATASANGKLEIVRRLLAAGVTPKPHALIEACRTDHVEIAALLLDAGVAIDASWNDTTPLRAAAWGGRAETLEWVIARGADVARSGPAALYAAANAGRTETVRLLLAHGVPVDARDRTGWTPLMAAAWQGKTETVRCLLERGADRGLQDSSGKRAIDWARKAAHHDVVALLDQNV